jgi:hypothetical protein
MSLIIDHLAAKAARLAAAATPDGYTGPSGAHIAITDAELNPNGEAVSLWASIGGQPAWLSFADQGRGFDDGAMLDGDAGSYDEVVAALAGNGASPETLARVRWDLEMLACRAVAALLTSAAADAVA